MAVLTGQQLITLLHIARHDVITESRLTSSTLLFFSVLHFSPTIDRRLTRSEKQAYYALKHSFLTRIWLFFSCCRRRPDYKINLGRCRTVSDQRF